MSITQLWLESLHKSVVTHFHSQDVGVPWELEREEEEDKVSFTLLEASLVETSRNYYEGTFTVLLVCTVSTLGLYDLSTLSGKVASLLLEPVSVLGVCATPSDKKVDIKLFDWKHGYKQSRMEQTYSVVLRG